MLFTGNVLTVLTCGTMNSSDVGQLVITPTITAQSEHAVAHFQQRYLWAIGE